MSYLILIIDDEDDIREVAALSLEVVAGWRVITASSGEEGVRKAAAERPDAILLDVMMPGLDGPATLRLLQEREETRQIPVVMLTAKMQGVDQRALQKLGSRGIIAKPFDPMTLSQQVAALLGFI